MVTPAAAATTTATATAATATTTTTTTTTPTSHEKNTVKDQPTNRPTDQPTGFQAVDAWLPSCLDMLPTLEEPCSPGVPGEMEIYNRYSMEDITNYYSYSNRDIGYSMYPHVRFMTKMGTYHKL